LEGDLGKGTHESTTELRSILPPTRVQYQNIVISVRPENDQAGVVTVSRIRTVRAQCFTNFAIDPVIVPQSAKCFNSKIGKALRSHKCQI
jgi:hypothetical protein